jgi:Tol biopolymer transport system component
VVLVSLALAACGARPQPGPELTGGFNPVWSPDGKQIAYIDGNRLMVMSSSNGRGKHPVRVRIPNWDPGSYFWELDWTVQSRIVFSGNSQLGTVNPATGRGRLLSPQVGSFSVSTDGRQVIYDHCYGGDHECSDSLAVVAATGGPSRLLPKPATASDGRPDLTPDGERVVFTRAQYDKHKGDTRGQRSLLIEPIAGGEARELRYSGFSPRWSPDRRWIAVCGVPYCAELLLIRATGGPSRGRLKRRVTSFSWSPDSKRLVCTTPDGVVGTVDLKAHFKAFPLGTTFRLESLEGVSVGPKAWSPDGRRIVFMGRTQEHGSVKGGIYVVRADGKGMRRLA